MPPKSILEVTVIAIRNSGVSGNPGCYNLQAMMTKQQILESAMHLPRDQQIDLAIEFWAAVDLCDEDFPLTEEQAHELDRRIAESDANPQPPEEIEALKARLLKGEF